MLSTHMYIIEELPVIFVLQSVRHYVSKWHMIGYVRYFGKRFAKFNLDVKIHCNVEHTERQGFSILYRQPKND